MVEVTLRFLHPAIWMNLGQLSPGTCRHLWQRKISAALAKGEKQSSRKGSGYIKVEQLCCFAEGVTGYEFGEKP